MKRTKDLGVVVADAQTIFTRRKMPVGSVLPDGTDLRVQKPLDPIEALVLALAATKDNK
jgi:hypothetical protein